MSLNCGIVGLPNVGKSTLFKALTAAPAQAANYPFCTIEPNVGIVEIADSRLQKIADIIKPKKIIPTVVEFVDIAGLVKGASQGEGLGNQFLGHIRSVNAIVHVIRCFEDDEVTHVHGNKMDPLEDMEIIDLELALADGEVVERRLSGLGKLMKGHDKKTVSRAKAAEPLLVRLKEALDKGIPARAALGPSPEDRELVKDLNLITLKPVLFACNIDEAGLGQENEKLQAVQRWVAKQEREGRLREGERPKVLAICGKLEAEIAALDTDEEKRDFMEAAGIETSALHKLAREAYDILGLRTYFTAGEKEVRAWTFPKGAKAPQAASIIHTDFERGFIKAEVYHCDELFELGSEAKIREKGKLRLEGKDYQVADGDVIHFRFNV